MSAQWHSFSEFLEAPAAAGRVRQVLDSAESFVGRYLVDAEQRRPIEVALAGLRLELESDGERSAACLFVHLPLLVYAGLRGEERPAVPLAVATTLLFLGIGPCGTILLCALAHLAIAELDAPPFVLAAIHRAVAHGLCRMSLAPAGRDGEQAALFARMAALMARAPEDLATAYEEMARAIGRATREPALRLLKQADPLEPARSRLEARIDGIRNFP